MRKYVIAKTKTGECTVITSDEFSLDSFEFIDDSDSAYKASVKLREIKAMGYERFIAQKNKTS